MTDKTQSEHNESALPLKADVQRRSRAYRRIGGDTTDAADDADASFCFTSNSVHRQEAPCRNVILRFALTAMAYSIAAAAA
jgi:hypothetical protein